MAIRIKHDAAGVVPPSNSSTRKYGQSLVMQQQQQKYQSQQAGYDRMFTALRDQNQNIAQQQRDWMQRDFALNRDKDRRDFITARDKEQFDQQQKLMDRQFDQQQKLMDRKLQQNLVAESEALVNPQLDATQRAEILDKIRAERATLSANRIEKPPVPTAQDLHDQSVVYQDGIAGQTDKNGMFVPLPQQTKRPTSAEDAFKSDPKLADKYFQDAKAIVTGDGETPYDEDARKKAMDLARKLYEQDNNLGTPTPAPAMSGQSQAPATPAQEQSILKAEGTPTTAPLMDSDRKSYSPEKSILETPPTSQQNNWPPPQETQVPVSPNSGQPTTSVSPTPSTQGTVTDRVAAEQAKRPFESLDELQQFVNTGKRSGKNEQTRKPYSPEKSILSPSAQTPSNWPPPAVQENASPSTTPITADEFNSGNPPKAAPSPDFSALASSAQTDQSRGLIKNLQNIYQQQSPDVQQAIAVYLDKNSSDADFQRAEQYLRSKGIDVLKLAGNVLPGIVLPFFP